MPAKRKPRAATSRRSPYALTPYARTSVTNTALWSVIVAGKLGLSVPLCGIAGAGKRMVLDAGLWDRVRLVLGSEWVWRARPGGSGYVISGRVKAAAHSGTSGPLILARYIAGAAPGEVVTYRDGDPLNLMRHNLDVRERAAFVARAFGHAKAA